MKIRVDRDALAGAVGWVARTVPARPAVPILAGILLELREAGPLVLSSSDEEASASAAVAVDAPEPGRVVVSGRLLSEIARHLPDGPIEITADATTVRVSGDGTTFTLRTLPAADYPAPPDPPPAIGAVAADVFSRAIGQVTVAAARDHALPVLTAVRFAATAETLTLACTDLYRIAVRGIPWQTAHPVSDQVALVPVRAVVGIGKTLASGADVVARLAPVGGTIGFDCPGPGGGWRRITVRLLEGGPIDYLARVAARGTDRIVATLATEAFADAVRRVSLVGERRTPVRLSFAGGRVHVAATAGEDAAATAVLPATCDADGPAEIAFNPRYLLDGLSAIDEPDVRLEFATATSPAFLVGVAPGERAPAFQYVMQPVHAR